MNGKIYVLLTALLVVPLSGCKKLFENPSVKYEYQVPEYLNDGLEVSDLSQEGIKKELIIQMTNQLNVDAYKNIHSVVIIKNNKLVYENYFNGYDREMLHNLYSASKTFTSAVLGVAIDKGFIPDTNAKAVSYFPEYAPLANDNPAKQSISLRHLLTMSSGLACNDWDPGSPGRENKLYKEDDLGKYLLDLPMTDVPGARAKYCSGGVILLSNIISKSTGQQYADFAKANLLDPLGISNYTFGYRENNRKDRPDQIYLRSRDMCKFGMLFLNDGKWHNTQLISPEWINASWESKTKLNGVDYGFLWWIFKGSVNGIDTNVYTASGNGGQFIFVIPNLNLVVAMTGGNLDSGYTVQGQSILYNYIIPANQ